MKDLKLGIRIFVTLAVLAVPGTLLAEGKIALAKKAVTEAVEYAMGHFGYKGVSGPLVQKAETLVAKYGDDVLTVTKKMGPEALETMEKLGPDAAKYIKLVMKNDKESIYIISSPKRLRIYINHGDDAITAMNKYKGILEEGIEKFGAPMAKASLNLEKSGAIQLSKMVKSGELEKIGRTRELLDVIGKYGQKAMDFIWKNKGSLMVGSTLVAFLNDPKPFIDGVVPIVAPISTELGKTPQIVASSINWTLVVLSGMGCFATMWFYKQWVRGRKRAKQTLNDNFVGNNN